MTPARLSLRVAMLVLSLGLVGCVSLGQDSLLVPGQSRAEDVAARYGQPTRVWPEADGGRTLEYASQPFGERCYMVRIAADGKLVSIEDALQPANRLRVEPGMTTEQVSRLLGRERSRMFFRLSGEEVWDWNVPPDQSGYLLRFNVHFKQGLVARTTYSMEFPLLDRSPAD